MIAFGDYLAVLIFHYLRNQSANFKGVVTTLKNRPFAGTLDCVEPFLN
jgi:hypothetical protein